MSKEPNDSSSNSSNEPKLHSTDVGWETAIRVGSNNRNDVQCLLCGKVTKAGINRHKIHISGIKGMGVAPCIKASEEQKVKCREALQGNKSKKIDNILGNTRLREEVTLKREEEEDEIGSFEGGSRKRPISLDPMDQFVKLVRVDDASTSHSKKKQLNTNDLDDTGKLQEVHQYLAKWVYEAGLPFNAIDNASFEKLCEAIALHGPGYTPPSQYQLREPLLEGEMERTKENLKKQEEGWKNNGCSIMIDAWSDGKRSITNSCVNCILGTTFLSSREVSNDAHTGEYIFEYVKECIEEVGAENVVQVVANSASNNIDASNLLSLERPNICWTSCATHTVNLMLKGISELPTFKGVIKKAKSFTIFIYAHRKTSALMRKFTKREIIRPGVTKFATSFLTLQSLLDKKQELRHMMVSKEWDQTKWSKSKKGKEVFSSIVPITFWNSIELCLKVFTALVEVLRLVGGENKPSLGFVYGELLKAKDDIKNALKESDYMPILNIIDAIIKDRLDSPLYTAAYFLNPFYFYKNSSIKDDALIISNVITCVEKFFPDYQMQLHVINTELPKYIQREGLFGKQMALNGCEKNDANYNLVGWWELFGNGTPNLKKMAKRILGLTASSLGCERNWSVFEGIHTTKRNRLHTTRMNNLVFVQFNARLMTKNKTKKDTLLANDARNAQSWIVDGCDDDADDENVRDENEIREPEDDDFVSDDTGDEYEEDGVKMELD